MLDVLSTNPTDWKYISEGGATIVFSYKGPPRPDFDGTVLRLRKSIVPSPGSHQDTKPTDIEQVSGDEGRDDPTVEYQTKCMERLIPSEHLPRLETVRLDRSWLENLVKLQDALRPQERREKDEIDLNRKQGVLAPDLVGGNWLAVEIKPKWAFLPSPTHLSEETRTVKTKTCRFCMYSQLKFQKNQQILSEYCPLDLFSGDEARVVTAINKLWDAWVASNATLNNLKIFARGKFVTPSEVSLLLADDVNQKEMLETLRHAFSTALVRPVIETPVLRILSKLQRDLDVLDIEGLSKLWRLAESSVQLYRTTLASQNKEGSTLPSTPLGLSSPFLQAPEPGIFEWNEFIDTYLDHKPYADHSNPSPEHLHYYLLAYLLSATFKDCSIMVKLDLLRPGIASEQGTNRHSVTVIDLDPKSMNKLRSWEKLDKEIAHNYALIQKKVCVDAWSNAI